jgi:hypothetical protein
MGKTKGICPYTDKLTTLRRNQQMMYKASLDRIDSSLGYIIGNIQFISATANLGKGSMTHVEMIMFCKLIRDNWNNVDSLTSTNY